MLAQWHVRYSYGTSTSVSTYKGDHKGRPGAVIMGTFVGVDLNL